MPKIFRFWLTALAVFLLTLILLAGTVTGGQSEANYVIVVKLEGQVEAIGLDGRELCLASGVKIVEGYRIETGPDSFIEVIWGQAGWARIDENTAVTVKASRFVPAENSIWARLKLTIGRVWVDLVHRSGDIIDFAVETPTITAGVRGTAFWVEQFSDGTSQVAVQRGLVNAQSAEISVDVGAQEFVRFDPQGQTIGAQKWDGQKQRLWESSVRGKDASNDQKESGSGDDNGQANKTGSSQLETQQSDGAGDDKGSKVAVKVR